MRNRTQGLGKSAARHARTEAGSSHTRSLHVSWANLAHREPRPPRDPHLTYTGTSLIRKRPPP